MTTYVFAWNPRLWGWPALGRNRRTIESRGHVDIEWACGRTRAIEPGSRAFFVRLGVPPKGLIGAGYNNGIGIAGLAPSAQLLVAKVVTKSRAIPVEAEAELPPNAEGKGFAGGTVDDNERERVEVEDFESVPVG